MKTNVALDLSEAQLRKLGTYLAGSPRPATRKQIVELVGKLVEDLLAPKPTRLMPVVCPKCSRPISVSVPCLAAGGGGRKLGENVQRRLDGPCLDSPPDVDAFAGQLRKLGKAMDQLASAANGLAKAVHGHGGSK